MSPKQKKSRKSQLVEQYGLNCYWCEKPFPENQLTLDHLIPGSKAKGLPGKNSQKNLRLACFPCNNSRGNKPYPPGHNLCWNKLSQMFQVYCELGIERIND